MREPTTPGPSLGFPPTGPVFQFPVDGGEVRYWFIFHKVIRKEREGERRKKEREGEREEKEREGEREEKRRRERRKKKERKKKKRQKK